MSTAQKVLAYLERYELKGKAPNYTANSPLRPGSNSHAFSLKIDSDEYGTYQDFVTGEKGSLYDLAKLLNIETPKREQVENSKRPYATLAEYAQLKGVPEQVFIEAKWEVHTYFDNRPCFKFPTLGGERYRFTDGQSPAFKSITGYQTCWYGLERAIKIADKKPLILCNGEPSTIVAQHFGLPAFCMPGGENQNPTQDMITHLKQAWKGTVQIAMDCDETGKKATKKFSEAFKLASIGYAVVDLMLTDKGDLADFCKLHSTSAAEDFSKLSSMRVQDLPDKPLDVTDLVKGVRELNNIRKGEVGNLEEVLDRLQAEINALRPHKGSVVSFELVSEQYSTWVKANMSHPGLVQGFKTGLIKLDELVGGLDRGAMYGVLAETGMGKTTVIATITSNLANQATGLVIPTEMRALDWWNQIIAYRTQIPKHIMRQGRLEPNQAGLVFSTNALLKQQKCKVIECQNPTVEHILETARQAIDEIGIEWIVLDSLSNVKSSVGGDSIFNTVSEAADCAQELARMGLAVLFTSQVGRSLENRPSRMPTKHDGKGSGRIEENADVVLGLYNHDNLVKQGIKQPMAEFPPETIALRCLKHRFLGEVEGKLIQLKFRGGVGASD